MNGQNKKEVRCGNIELQKSKNLTPKSAINLIYYNTSFGNMKGEPMKKEFKRARAIVKEVLEEYPMARNSNDYLYTKVIEKLNKEALNKPFADVMLNLKELGLPLYETISRARRKLQSEFPELQACDAVQDFRTEREEAFREEFGS